MKPLPRLLLTLLVLLPAACTPKGDIAGAEKLIADVDAAQEALHAAVKRLPSDSDPSGTLRNPEAFADEMILRADVAIARGGMPGGLPHRKANLGLRISETPTSGYPLRAIASQKAGVLVAQYNLLNEITGERSSRKVKAGIEAVARQKLLLAELLNRGRAESARAPRRSK